MAIPVAIVEFQLPTLDGRDREIEGTKSLVRIGQGVQSREGWNSVSDYSCSSVNTLTRLGNEKEVTPTRGMEPTYS